MKYYEELFGRASNHPEIVFETLKDRLEHEFKIAKMKNDEKDKNDLNDLFDEFSHRLIECVLERKYQCAYRQIDCRTSKRAVVLSNRLLEALKLKMLENGMQFAWSSHGDDERNMTYSISASW